jgi:hypothetical protein
MQHVVCDDWEVLYNSNSFVVVNFVFRRLIFWLEGPEMQKVMEDFKQWRGLFNMQGVTNGTHVLISKPSIPYPEDYYYHKSKGHSMVAQAMVDSNKKFIDIFIGSPRNVNDSQVLKSKLCQQAQYHVLFHLNKRCGDGTSCYLFRDKGCLFIS